MPNTNEDTEAAGVILSGEQIQCIALGCASYMAGEIIKHEQVDHISPGMNDFYDGLQKEFLRMIETIDTKEDEEVQTGVQMMVSGAVLLAFKRKHAQEVALRSRIDREDIEKNNTIEAWKQTAFQSLKAEYSAKVESCLKEVKISRELLAAQEKLVANLNETISAKDRKTKAAARTQEEQINLLRNTLTAKDKRLEEVEGGIKARERELRLREQDFKNREEEAQDKLRKQDKEASKGTGKELKLVKAKLKESEATIANLEKQLLAAAENHEVLKLDFAATTADLEALNRVRTTESKSDEALKEEVHKLRDELKRYKGLYERNRTSKKTIDDETAKAVRIGESKQATQFEIWKARTAEVVAQADSKLAAAEERVLAAEKWFSVKDGVVWDTVAEVLDDGEMEFNDVSKGRLELEECIKAGDKDIKAKNAEIKRLKLQAKQAIAILEGTR